MSRLSDADFESIFQAIQNGQTPHEIVYGKVVSRDERRKLIKIESFGDQWIPLVGLRQKVTYYDTTPTGVKEKSATIEPQVPAVGETAVILRQMGERRLGKCVGVVLSSKSFVG